ncbi:MAG: hypothetical protein ABUL73_00925 [Alphaproteobacteria bacterium]
MTHNDALADFLGPELFARLEWAQLSEEQRAAILSVFRVGICAGAQSGAVSIIDSVLAEGRIVICEDGSHWAARARDDAEIIEDWGEGAMIAIHRGLAYRLDPYQCAEVDVLRL